MKILINENQLRRLINEEIEIDELRRSHYQYVKDKTKQMTGQEWPEYVLMDWLYKNTSASRSDHDQSIVIYDFFDLCFNMRYYVCDVVR